MGFKLKDAEKKIKAAKDMYYSGATGKKIAQTLGLTEKTVSLWVSKYRWKTDRAHKLDDKLKAPSPAKVYPIYYGFSLYLEAKNTDLLNVIELEILNYLKS